MLSKHDSSARQSLQEVSSPFTDTLAFLATASRPLIVIIGPTASGKTQFSIDLALQLRQRGYAPEIINADSRQFYRGFDIGTAKITPQEMSGIPHHLLDVLDPGERVTIAWFIEHATATIQQIHARGGVPFLVGGSMLYVSALIDGYNPLPSDPTLRRRLEEEYDRDNGVSAYERLRSIDPDACTFARENRKYVLRALEMIERTGMRKSLAVSTILPSFDLALFGIRRSREELRQRLDVRTAALFDKGWIREVQQLLDAGVSLDAPAMESHGYREIAAALGSCNGIISLQKQQELIMKIATKGRQYAKRHDTWWRRDDRVHWITP